MSALATRQLGELSDPVVGPYAGFRAALATMHGKERAITPSFRDRLAMTVVLAPDIDTDTLGTFTGEIPRAGTIRAAAVAKARLGMTVTGLPIGIASEGAYGPHPSVPFIPCGIELLVLVDDERGIVVCEHLVDDAPVYDHIVANGIGAMPNFLQRVRFPDHALIARPNAPMGRDAPHLKGLRTVDSLARAIIECAAWSRDGNALVQTDMRAHMNPTRMAKIGRLSERICDRLVVPSPSCASPGYGQIDIERGLPCGGCGGPSHMVLHQIFGCFACNHRERRRRSDDRTHADPSVCPECNP